MLLQTFAKMAARVAYGADRCKNRSRPAGAATVERLLRSLVRTSAVVFGLAATLLPFALRAQQITGEISGTVTDASGARIPAAVVIVTDSDTNEVVRKLKSNAEGIYQAPLLQVGNYSVEASAPNFEPKTIEHIEVDVSSSVKVDIALTAGNSETVQVNTANNLSPDLENGAVGSVITGSEIKDLALNTRNFEQVVQLQPGVVYGGSTDQLYTGRVSPSGAATSAALAINGLRPDQNAWLLDGADFLAHNTGMQVVIYPSVEAIGQIKVLRNSYGAQYGGGGNAQIEVITKAGTSNFHGDLHMFVRNSIFNANYYFNNLAGEPRPLDSEYTGGLSVGGPVFLPHLLSAQKLNTFFFYALEIRRDRVAQLQSSSDIPTPGELQGIFPDAVCQFASTTSTACSGTNQITNIDPTSAAYIKDVFSKIGVPNNPLDPNGIIQDKIGVHNENEQLLRLDHAFSTRLSAFFRYVHDPINLYTPNGYGSGSGYPGVTDSTIATTGNAYLLHATYALTPATVLDASVSYEPFSLHATPVGALASANSPDIHFNLPFVSTLAHVPGIELQDGADNYNTTGPVNDVNENIQAFANLFHIYGKHSVSVGANLELYREAINQGGNNAGLFNFENTGGKPTGSAATAFEIAFSNFLQGRVNFFQQNSIDPVSNASIKLAEGYIQDDWKVLPRLTLNGGVRYSFFQQPHEANNHLGSFAPRFFNPAQAVAVDNTGNLCSSPSCQNPNAVANDGFITGGVNSPYGAAVDVQPTLGFSPRVGFAFDVLGDGKSSLKGGYGIFFSESQLNLVHNAVFNDPFYVQEVIYNTPSSFANPGSNASLAPLSAYGIAENWRTPYVQGYSLELQHEFPGQTLLDIAYSGNISQHLPGQVDINQPYPGEFITANLYGGTTTNGVYAPKTVSNSNTPVLNSIRPYQGYGTIILEVPEFRANYNGLQTALNKRLGESSRLSVNYTWSKGLTNNTSTTGAAPQNSYDPAAEYGLISYDRRHVFTVHYTYELPFYKQQHGWVGHTLGGWSSAGIVTAVAGLPLTTTTSNVDPAGQGLLAPNSPETERPDQLNPHPNEDAPHNIHSVINGVSGYWFNPNDFANVAAPTCPVGQIQTCVALARPGNARIGNIRGPGYQVWNLDIFKNIRTSDRTRLQFRVEAFNVFNHPNWQGINAQRQVGKFGQITSDRDPRQMQLGARFFY